jgi:DNA-binding GntR family transcriptional regulator
MANAISNHDSEKAKKITEEHTQEFLESLSKKFFG